MQCAEFVLWNKIHLFGEEIKARLLAEAGAETSKQKADFLAAFDAKSLNDLLAEKLIKTDKANEMAGKALSIDQLKLSLPVYKEIIEGSDPSTVDVFGQIIQQYIKVLEAKKPAVQRAAARVARAEEDPLAKAIGRLKK